jgi:hypothetical protein
LRRSSSAVERAVDETRDIRHVALYATVSGS